MIQVDGIFVQQGGGTGSGLPFTYSSEFILVQEDETNWKAYLPTSGILIFNEAVEIEYQLIGSGSGGGNSNESSVGKRGGGGNSVVGTLTTVPNQEYITTIGAGGTANSNGNYTSAFGQTAAGGTVGTMVNVFEFNDTSGIRQSGYGGAGAKNGSGVARNSESGQNAGYTDVTKGGGVGGGNGSTNGATGDNGSMGWNGSKGGNGGRCASLIYQGGGGGGGGGGGYGGGGGGAGQCSGPGTAAAGGTGAPGVVILRNARGVAA